MKTRKTWLGHIRGYLDKASWMPAARPHTDPGIAWLYMRMPDETKGDNEAHKKDTH